MEKPALSSAASVLVDGCARLLGTSPDELVGEFELASVPAAEPHCRKLVEVCSSRALAGLCRRESLGEEIGGGCFARLTFDMMLAWEVPGSADEDNLAESVAKEMEDTSGKHQGNGGLVNDDDDDDVPLFYSDIMPLLVGEERGVGEDAFVWLGSLVPLAADVVSARFTFEALTASTSHRLYFPAYDRFLKEMDKCIKYLQKQATPTGVILEEDEFILHVEGTANTHRVVRHIGTTSWPGRLTLTNRALYFEASGILSYENALRVDLSIPDLDHQISTASTGPWGAPLFDKAIVYESSQLPEQVILEFPEITGSTRRDLWLAIMKEIIQLHQFLPKFNIISNFKSWEMQARTMLGIIRLHAAREMLRISQPVPRNFLIFTLFDELPKGDYVMEELSNSLKMANEVHPCSASSILKSFNISHPIGPSREAKEGIEYQMSAPPGNLESLETTICQVREEAKEVGKVRAIVEGIKEEGITYSLFVLTELLSPLKGVIPWLKGVLAWERPALTLMVLAGTLVITYKEWVGFAVTAILLWGVGMMRSARRQRVRDKVTEVMVSTSFDQTAMESIVTAQHSLRSLRTVIQSATIIILKLQSIFVSRAPKHADQAMLGMFAAAIFFALVPFKFMIMALLLYSFAATWMAHKYQPMQNGPNGQFDRRVREWWDSIPVIPVRIVDDDT